MFINYDKLDQALEYASKQEVLAVDTEGFVEDNNRLLASGTTLGVSIAGHNFEAYFPFNHLDAHNNLNESYFNKLKGLIENHPRVVFHNAKHDIIALERLGINTPAFYDTMLMAHWIDENIPNKKLDYLSVKYEGEPKKRSDMLQRIIDSFGWQYVPVPEVAPYAENDARITWDLFWKLYPEFKDQGFDTKLWDIEQRFCRLLGHMELQGVKINKELCETEYERGIEIMQKIETELGFNPASPIDLSKFLLEEMQFPVVKTTPKGKPSFDKEAMKVYDELLELRNDPRASLVKTYRGWQKTCSSNYKSYLDLMSPDGRIRCNYKLHGTKTGRLSCENPNLQQIPRNSTQDWNGHLKAAFIGKEGFKLWEGDYSQLEFRISAAYAKQKNLIEVFADENRDIFDEISKELNMKRQDVKTLTYTIAYGGGVNRIKDVFNVSTHTAKAIINRYYDSYPNLRRISKKAQDMCLDNGYVRLWSGRRRHFANPEREAHKAFNSAAQGGAAEVVKRTMLRLDDEGLNNNECRMLLQVHDSVVSEIEIGKEHIYLPEIKRVMEDVKPDFGVKFRADIHEWGN